MLTWTVPSINLSIKYIKTWIRELHGYKTHLVFQVLNVSSQNVTFHISNDCNEHYEKNNTTLDYCPRRVLASRGGTLGFPVCIHIGNFKM